ncbi:MAG: LTA synthase family protein [Clostridia bacterium]|nr:LTA synthase family protein [Clostridia bacterium]
MNSKNRLPFLLLFLAMVVKFAWFYNMLSVTSNYFFVIIFTTVFYGGLLLLFSKKPWITIGLASILTIIFECEVLYFRYFNKLLSFYNVSQARFVNSVSNVMLSLIRPGDIILLLDLLVLAIILFYNKDLLVLKKRFKIVTTAFVVILVPCLTLASFGSDFGISVMNQEFFMYHTKDGIEVYQSEITDESEPVLMPEPISIHKPEIIPDDEIRLTGLFKGKNLITIQVESLQDMVINKTYNGQEITPFLNSLIGNDTFYFSSYYQQLGKGNTSDAEFSSHNSLYPSMESISYLRYQNFKFSGLPVLLKEQGYKTLAFHGNEASFWCREEAYPTQGFEEFYSEERLDINEVIGMGLSDKSLFKQGAEILSKEKSPFYGFFVTITNHNPYKIPKALVTIDLKPEDEDTLFGRYIESVHYTDEALKLFYDELEAKGLLENTVFVIYGDHHGISAMDKSYNESVTKFIGEKYDLDQMMNIPLFIHAPGMNISENIDEVSDQQDLLPTLKNLFDLKDDSFTVGQDLLNTNDHFVLFQTYMIKGSFIWDDIVFDMSRDGIYEHSRAWNRKTKEPIDLELCRDGYERALYEIALSRYYLENNIVVSE